MPTDTSSIPTSGGSAMRAMPPRANFAGPDHTLVFQAVTSALKEFDQYPVDHATIPQERLNLAHRHRTSLFPWRGQFSPELIELLLVHYVSERHLVVDPFVGSGTTLFEAARRSLPCVGTEINPAAVVMASTVHFVNIRRDERYAHIRAAERIIEKHVPAAQWDGLFALSEGLSTEPQDSTDDCLKEIVRQAHPSSLIHSIIANTLIRFLSSSRSQSLLSLFHHIQCHKAIIERLPYSPAPCRVFQCDARRLPVEDSSTYLILTSPPYINVFNYHQNHRSAMELMGWDILDVARSEFGSNRKNRANRFLTVVQYTLDMDQALHEMRRIIAPAGRVIVIIGRESSVRGVSFQNGRLVAALAVGSAGFRLDLRQERQFKTKFGETIYEDILHFVPSVQSVISSDDYARQLAMVVLDEAACVTRGDVREDIQAAIDRARYVDASPQFKPMICSEESQCSQGPIWTS